jgi:hypothetical protein
LALGRAACSGVMQWRSRLRGPTMRLRTSRGRFGARTSTTSLVSSHRPGAIRMPESWSATCSTVMLRSGGAPQPAASNTALSKAAPGRVRSIPTCPSPASGIDRRGDASAAGAPAATSSRRRY